MGSTEARTGADALTLALTLLRQALAVLSRATEEAEGRATKAEARLEKETAKFGKAKEGAKAWQAERKELRASTLKQEEAIEQLQRSLLQQSGQVQPTPRAAEQSSRAAKQPGAHHA